MDDRRTPWSFRGRSRPGAPLLAVEVPSPSTRLVDRNLTKARSEEAGRASFQVVDPLEPRLTAWDLVDGAVCRDAHPWWDCRPILTT